MQVWNKLNVARWKYRTQKIAIWAPSYLLHMSSQYGELRPANGWDRFGSTGHPSKFQRVSRLALVTAATSLTGGQPNLHDVWPSPGLVYYVYILGALAPWWNFVSCKSHFASKSCVLQYWQHYCTPAVGVSQSLRRGKRNGIMKLLQRAPPIFGRAAITLGIGPDSSLNIMHLLIMQWCFWRSSNSNVVVNAKLILFTHWFKSIQIRLKSAHSSFIRIYH